MIDAEAGAVPEGAAAAGFGSDYRRGVSRHVRIPDEATLRQAYELGRAAIMLDIGPLDIATAHHDALRSLLQPLGSEQVEEILARAADFLSEALTAYEMMRRSFLALSETDRQQRHHAAVVRGLSALLADTSLAAHGRESIAEMLQLVVEHARELTNASRCTAELTTTAWPGPMTAVAGGNADANVATPPDFDVQLTSLDGSRLGSITLWRASSNPLSELDEALVVHIAQMASAALDRAALFAPGSSRPRATRWAQIRPAT